MTGLINLINQHQAKLSILPIIVVITIIITVLMNFLASKKIVKYIPSLALILGGLLLMIYSLSIFTTRRGINLTWIATFIGASGLVGLFTAFIIDLINSLMQNAPNAQTTNVRAVKKTNGKNHISARKKTEENKAKKTTSAKNSKKYQTTRIKPVDNKAVSARKTYEGKTTKSVSYKSDSDKE